MSDVVREFISDCQVGESEADIEQALAALDAERAEHAKEVDDLKKWRIVHRLEIEKLEQEIADLRQQLTIRDTHVMNLNGVIFDLRQQVDMAHESLSWYEKRDIMRQTNIEEEVDLKKDLDNRCSCRFDPGVQEPVTVCAYHKTVQIGRASCRERVYRLV